MSTPAPLQRITVEQVLREQGWVPLWSHLDDIECGACGTPLGQPKTCDICALKGRLTTPASRGGDLPVISELRAQLRLLRLTRERVARHQAEEPVDQVRIVAQLSRSIKDLAPTLARLEREALDGRFSNSGDSWLLVLARMAAWLRSLPASFREEALDATLRVQAELAGRQLPEGR